MDPTIISSFLLGAVQGITEFLPVSSSGHLTIFQHLYGLTDPEANLALDILLHSATLLAVIWFFRADLYFFFSPSGRVQPSTRHLAKMIVISSVPTAIIGLGFKKQFEALFGEPNLVCLALMATGILLFSAHLFSRNKPGSSVSELTYSKALFIGVMQGIAIIPGISRSGATIAAGLFAGLRGQEAGRFSFLLMIVSVGGATLLESRKLFSSGAALDWAVFPLAVGWVSSFFIGILCLGLLMMVLKRQNLQWFALYLVLAGPFYYWQLNRSPTPSVSTKTTTASSSILNATGTPILPVGGQ